MAISDLIALVPPPEMPLPAVASWSAVEEEIGTALPTDYKAFVETYGSGRLPEFIVVFSPFGQNSHANLIVQKDVQLGTLQELRDEWAEVLP